MGSMGISEFEMDEGRSRLNGGESERRRRHYKPREREAYSKVVRRKDTKKAKREAKGIGARYFGFLSHQEPLSGWSLGKSAMEHTRDLGIIGRVIF